jgi:hypothetical protein
MYYCEMQDADEFINRDISDERWNEFLQTSQLARSPEAYPPHTTLCTCGETAKGDVISSQAVWGTGPGYVLIPQADATQSVSLLMLLYSAFNGSSNCSV